ncbi:MAG: ribosome silencing factor [Bacteriovoracaceae bacterium]
MSSNRDFILANVEKIMGNSANEESLNLAYGVTWVMANFKGTDLKILDMRGISSLADFFIIGSASNMIMAQAMSNMVMRVLRESKIKVRSLEGYESAEWILIDAGDVMVHIFQEGARLTYDIETVWKNAGNITIPSEYYVANPEITLEMEKIEFQQDEFKVENYF